MSKILVVDDAYFVRIKIKSLLVESGYDVIEAESGEDAIELFKSENPALVLLDIIMPGMNGIEALKNIIRIDSNANVVMLTGEGDKQVLMDALSSGAKNFLIKPVDESKLLDAIVNALK